MLVAGVSGAPISSARLRTFIYLHDPTQPQPQRIEVYALQRIDIITPAQDIVTPALHDIEIHYADPEFRTRKRIDIVLGVNVYSQILRAGMIQGPSFVVQQTCFGWTVTGAFPAANKFLNAASTTMTEYLERDDHEKLIELVRRFWAVEDVPKVVRPSRSDVASEEIFSHHKRDQSGRYVVPLLVDTDKLSLLGESLSQAQLMLSSMHKRMRKDPRLAEECKNFMKDYINLNHMRLLAPEELKGSNITANYLPYHAIWQRGDEGPKLRIVFNASQPTSTGHSLNDVLLSGPKLQGDLAAILTRWRRHRVAFCADIRMMFRQIRIDPRHAHLQRIVWAPSEYEPVSHYILQTVTYGETCAPYLALRTLRQLCIDDGARFPEAVDAIQNALYMDDFLTGADDLPAARDRRDQLIGLLSAGGFNLKKWVSNCSELLDEIHPDDRLRREWLQFSESPVNELGVSWNPIEDSLVFVPPRAAADVELTKRRALAELARIFDPAGWLAPVTVVAKMIIQDLWRGHYEWDDAIPQPWLDKWMRFRKSMSDVSSLQIPRWIGQLQTSHRQLHAFADASHRAMAATVYSRITDASGKVIVRLLLAKTKLTSARGLRPPVKGATRMTIPRLELRATLLASKLLEFAAIQLKVPYHDCHAWTDSRVALHWIRSEGPVTNHLIENYICHIQEVATGVTWHHVSTTENPADVATRGTDTRNLSRNSLWWNGPDWLKGAQEKWPSRDPLLEYGSPTETEVTRCLVQTIAEISHTTYGFSNLDMLLRVMTRCRRLFLARRSATAPPPLAPVTADDMHREFLTAVRLSQKSHFLREAVILQKEGHLKCNKALRPLNVFLADDGLIRVGGRLEHSNLSFDERHPPILHGKSDLARLVIRWAHEKSLHGGFRVTYARVLQRAWIVGGRVAIKAFTRGCVTCARAMPRPSQQIMANLPEARVTPSRPFSRCGVDYAGPFQILRSKGRGTASAKGYIALFVCLCTKAIHLEAAGDLSTESFLGALIRFIGRRGKPTEIWSDNGRNFLGADRELKKLLREAKMDWGLIESKMAQEQIVWKFIPPTAPHFGGLWEAGVKSAKVHLQRVIGPRKLTFEELSTFLAEVEMILNNRPLTPISGELDDIDALTPAHFLVGGSLTTIPRPSNGGSSLDHRAHWDLVRGLRDHFWGRWSKEYLNTLQQRVKWSNPRPNIEVGDIVVLLDPSLIKPDGRWPLGRVVETHPGSDGHTRVATVKTSIGIYKRPIVKLSRLPIALQQGK